MALILCIVKRRHQIYVPLSSEVIKSRRKMDKRRAWRDKRLKAAKVYVN